MSLQHYYCNKCTKLLTCTACDRSDIFLKDGDAHIITFRVRLALPSTTMDDASLPYSESKRLELKLQSAHDTGDVTTQDPVELPSSISGFITYIIQKIYAGGNSSSSTCNHYDRKADLQCLKMLVNMNAPDLEEASFVYNIVGGVNSSLNIRQGFRNAEATSSSSTFHFDLCANESADVPMKPNGMSVAHGGGGEVIDFVLRVNHGDRAGMSKKSRRKVDKVVEVSQEEHAQKDIVLIDRQQSIRDSQSLKSKNTEEADSLTRYPSKYEWFSF